jgi:1-acyl-sn-glycerol-3-phosphate acyltransferase
MLHTLIAVVKFFWYLVRSQPERRVVERLDREGRVAERDAIVNDKVGSWARYVVKIAGGTVEVAGAENVPRDTAVVFVGNHQSNLDIPILLGFIDKPKAFISKIEVLKVPYLGAWMRFMQCTFIDRKDMRQSVRAMQEAIETVKKGYSLVIFPEGHRSKGAPVAEFKAGSFKLALKAGVPIVPVTIDGSWRLLEEKGRLQDARVRVTLHPAIPTAGLSREEAATIPERVQAVVMSALTDQSFR